MMKKMLMASFIGAMLLLSGCSNTDGEDRLEIEQMLNDGDFTGVISALESDSDANRTTLSEDMTLGSAYMGAAGLTTSDLIGMVADSSTATAAPALRSTRATGDDEAFARFAEEIQKNAKDNPKVMEYLDKAIKAFKKVETAAQGTENAKFFQGLGNVAKATTTFTYLGDIAKMIENGIDNELLASSCAIVYVYAGTYAKDCQNAYIVANNSDTNASLYKELKITLTDGRGEYRRLITEDGTEVVITDGYINVDGNDTNDSNNGANSAKPVQDETLTVTSALLSTLNTGFDLIIEIAPEDIIDEIRDFRSEIDANSDGDIDAQEMSDYIDNLVDDTV